MAGVLRWLGARLEAFLKGELSEWRSSRLADRCCRSLLLGGVQGSVDDGRVYRYAFICVGIVVVPVMLACEVWGTVALLVISSYPALTAFGVAYLCPVWPR